MGVVGNGQGDIDRNGKQRENGAREKTARRNILPSSVAVTCSSRARKIMARLPSATLGFGPDPGPRAPSRRLPLGF